MPCQNDNKLIGLTDSWFKIWRYFQKSGKHEIWLHGGLAVKQSKKLENSKCCLSIEKKGEKSGLFPIKSPGQMEMGFSLNNWPMETENTVGWHQAHSIQVTSVGPIRKKYFPYKLNVFSINCKACSMQANSTCAYCVLFVLLIIKLPLNKYHAYQHNKNVQI